MTGVSKAATSAIKNLTKESGAQKSGGVTRFFKKLFPGKTTPPAPQFQVPKDQWVKSQVDNLAAIKADKAYFENATTQNKKELVKEVRAFRQAQRQAFSPANVSRQTVKPQTKPSLVRQNVTAQPLETAKPVHKNGVNLQQTGLPKDLQDRLARFKGIDPNKTEAQTMAELQTRLAALKRPIPSRAPSLAKEAADLERIRKLPSNVQITPVQFQAETKRLKSLERIQQTRRDIMADTQLTAAQRRKQLDGLNTILKDYT